MRSRLLRTVAVVAMFALGACGGSNEPKGPVVDVTIADVTFTPSTVVVAAGGSVRWTNASATERHNIIPAVAGSFEKREALLKNGASTEITFATPGEYPYYCSLHGSPTSGQRGIVRVTP